MADDTSKRRLVLISIPALAPQDEDHQDWRATFEFGKPGFILASGYGGEWRNLLAHHEAANIRIHPDATIVFYNRTPDCCIGAVSASTHYDILEVNGPTKAWSNPKNIPVLQYRSVLTDLGIPWMSVGEWIASADPEMYPRISAHRGWSSV